MAFSFYHREMLGLLKALDPAKFSPVSFVVADTDKLSREKAELDFPGADFVVIPRYWNISNVPV